MYHNRLERSLSETSESIVAGWSHAFRVTRITRRLSRHSPTLEQCVLSLETRGNQGIPWPRKFFIICSIASFTKHGYIFSGGRSLHHAALVCAGRYVVLNAVALEDLNATAVHADGHRDHDAAARALGAFAGDQRPCRGYRWRGRTGCWPADYGTVLIRAEAGSSPLPLP